MKKVLAILILTVVAMASTDSAVRWKSDAAMHEYFIKRFLESAGNGMERMLTPTMTITDSMWLTEGTRTFKLGTLELVGIANHESPVAFVELRHRPFSSDKETRTLTAFETRALKELQAGTEITSEADRRGRTVVGALRARQECLGCHNSNGQKYQAGDLLGALVYRLDSAKLPANLQ
jgi:hypothetical protein